MTRAQLQRMGEAIREIDSATTSNDVNRIECALDVLRDIERSERSLFAGEVEVPQTLACQEFLEKWDEYVAWRRREGFRVLKASSVRVKFSQFARYPVEAILLALDEAMANRYQGVFPDKFSGRAYDAERERLRSARKERERARYNPS